MRFLLFAQCISLLLVSLVLPVRADTNFQVLAVHSYSQEYPWTKSQHEGFVAELVAASKLPLNITTEYLDTKRRPLTPDYTINVVQYLLSKYKDYKPDVIYVTDDNAFIFARDYLSTIFPSIPVFFSGVNDYDVLNQLQTLPARGVFEKKDISKNLKLLMDLDEQTDSILVVGDASNTYIAIEHEIKQQLTGFPNIKATYIADSRMDMLVESLRGRNEKFL
ncbi:MAG: hypothetical protein KAU21_07355, partial [Gammaproteobacteria bacterium]|nr:hypothetical protein [Gammaproteobacteria bacterium]